MPGAWELIDGLAARSDCFSREDGFFRMLHKARKIYPSPKKELSGQLLEVFSDPELQQKGVWWQLGSSITWGIIEHQSHSPMDLRPVLKILFWAAEVGFKGKKKTKNYSKKCFSKAANGSPWELWLWPPLLCRCSSLFAARPSPAAPVSAALSGRSGIPTRCWAWPVVPAGTTCARRFGSWPGRIILMFQVSWLILTMKRCSKG